MSLKTREGNSPHISRHVRTKHRSNVKMLMSCKLRIFREVCDNVLLMTMMMMTRMNMMMLLLLMMMKLKVDHLSDVATASALLLLDNNVRPNEQAR